MFYAKLHIEWLKPFYRGLYLAFWLGKRRWRMRLFRFIPNTPGHFFVQYVNYYGLEEDD